MQRVWVLNGNNITYDKDLTAGILSSLTQWVIEWFDTSWSWASAEILPWKALIEVTRSNWEKILVFFESTTNEAINLTWTKKIYIEIEQSKIDDWSSNNEDWTDIWQITTSSTYPSNNFIPLYDVASWVVTDERENVKWKLLRKNLESNKIIYLDNNWEEKTLSLWTNWQVLTSTWTSTAPNFTSPAVDINWLPEKTSPVSDDLILLSDSEDSNQNKKAKISSIKENTETTVTLWEAVAINDALYIDNATWKAFKTQANDTWKLNFIGFAKTAWVLDDNIQVITSWVKDGFTGLIVGSEYFLSNTVWQISTTAGTNEVKVWTAISATQIIIQKQNGQEFTVYDSVLASRSASGATWSVVYNHNLWRVPRRINITAIIDSWTFLLAYSKWTYITQTNSNKCAYKRGDDWWQSSIQSIVILDSTSDWQRWVITNVTSTTFTISWTLFSWFTGNINLIFDLEW